MNPNASKVISILPVNNGYVVTMPFTIKDQIVEAMKGHDQDILDLTESKSCDHIHIFKSKNEVLLFLSNQDI